MRRGPYCPCQGTGNARLCSSARIGFKKQCASAVGAVWLEKKLLSCHTMMFIVPNQHWHHSIKCNKLFTSHMSDVISLSSPNFNTSLPNVTAHLFSLFYIMYNADISKSHFAAVLSFFQWDNTFNFNFAPFPIAGRSVGSTSHWSSASPTRGVRWTIWISGHTPMTQLAQSDVESSTESKLTRLIPR